MDAIPTTAMKPRVYVETTVPSFYFEIRKEPENLRSHFDDAGRAQSLGRGGFMMKDPAVEEIREVRRKISREYETTEEFLDHYRSLEKAHEPRMLKSVSAKKKVGAAE